MRKRFVITGASGHIGRYLTKLCQNQKHPLLLVGRDRQKLEKLFPGVATVDYAQLPGELRPNDIIVHLAVENNDNNDKRLSQNNAAILSEVLLATHGKQIEKLIFLNSFHALPTSKRNHTDYSRSKIACSDMLAREKSFPINSLYIPAVYSQHSRGNLRFLNSIPPFARRLLASIIRSVVPVISVENVTSAICQIAINTNETRSNIYLSDSVRRNFIYRFWRLSLDIIFSVSTILFASWLMLLIFIAIISNSPGGAIFTQLRVGRNTEPFKCHKFRTMKHGTEQAGTHEISENRITGVGRFLRRTKLDELPQAWDILRKKMSLIGPRPCLPAQKELIYERKVVGVFHVLPGVTGLAQVNGIDMSNPSKLADMDAQYIAQQSIMIDIKILLATLFGHGSGDHTRSS